VKAVIVAGVVAGVVVGALVRVAELGTWDLRRQWDWLTLDAGSAP
jgi:hypothetical protein